MMRRRRLITRLGWLAALGLGLLSSSAADAQLPTSQAPEWRWRQILSVPRVGSRLTAITVDPRDPRRIYVGTEEGTLLKSEDAGVTWMEVEFRPFMLYSRSLGLKKPGLPRLGATTKNNFRTFVDPPWVYLTDRIEIPSVGGLIFIKPDFFYAGFLATSPKPPVTLLGDASASRYKYTIPVKRIALCPGGNYEIIIATYLDVFASQDGGNTFVRLFSNPGRTSVSNVDCNPDNPDEIAVSTGIGLFVSKDGGRTFDQDLDAWPGQSATAVAYGPSAGSGAARLYSAAGSELFAGQFGTELGLQNIYPSGASASTAPWTKIKWISTNKRGDVWLATYDGARFSPDYGQTWKTAARTLLSRQVIRQVQLGENEQGGTRVALLLNVEPVSGRGKPVSVGVQDSHVYASDDGGETWHPFFHGLSVRYFYQMTSVPSTSAHPAGWWVVTSGGVWTTYPSETPQQINANAAAWAQRRIAQTPDIQVVIDEVLDNNELSNERIHAIADAHRAINWIPRLDLLFGWAQLSDIELSDRFDSNAGPRNVIVNRAPIDGEPYLTNAYSFFAQASWDLKDVLNNHEDLNGTRYYFHRMRRQIEYAAQDAWHERMNLLGQLERLSDPFQVETNKARIETLEAMLAVWLGRSLADLHTSGPTRR